jgi:hypothetical protein
MPAGACPFSLCLTLADEISIIEQAISYQLSAISKTRHDFAFADG